MSSPHKKHRIANIFTKNASRSAQNFVGLILVLYAGWMFYLSPFTGFLIGGPALIAAVLCFAGLETRKETENLVYVSPKEQRKILITKIIFGCLLLLYTFYVWIHAWLAIRNVWAWLSAIIIFITPLTLVMGIRIAITGYIQLRHPPVFIKPTPDAPQPVPQHVSDPQPQPVVVQQVPKPPRAPIFTPKAKGIISKSFIGLGLFLVLVGLIATLAYKVDGAGKSLIMNGIIALMLGGLTLFL